MIIVSEEANNILIAITDYAIGMSSQQLPLIFDRFYRVNDYAANGAGLGLGLLSPMK
jgi:signal transduction histidine kinase